MVTKQKLSLRGMNINVDDFLRQILLITKISKYRVVNMHISILERQQLRRDGLSTFHIHNPVQSIFHQKAFSNTAISVQTFSHVRVREFSRIHGK